MPTLSLRIIKNPRKKRKCDNCYKPITGEAIRLYGMAEIGDKPYQVFLHRECVSGREESEMLRAAELLRAPVQAGARESMMIYDCPQCGRARNRYDDFVQSCEGCGHAEFYIERRDE